MVHADGARPIRVLVAENDARVRAALRTFLSAHPGIEVVAEAGGPAAALALARAHTPTVALVDVYLPAKDDGLGLLRAINGELGIPVVAISIEGSARESALHAGAFRFLDKSRVPDQLLAALELTQDS